MISDAISINGQRYVLREDYDVLAARCERADDALLTERGKLEKADELTQTLMARCAELERYVTTAAGLLCSDIEHGRAYIVEMAEGRDVLSEHLQAAIDLQKQPLADGAQHEG